MWLMQNGQLVPEKEAVVSVFDHGFMYGVGLFETLRVYDGQPFQLRRHWERLLRSAEEIGIDFTVDLAELERQIARLLVANEQSNAYVRISVSAGPAALGLPAEQYSAPQLIIYMKPLQPVLPFCARPVKALQLLELRRSSPEGFSRYKSFHYLNNLLGKQECARYPWTHGLDVEGLFLNEKNQLAEGVVSNLFFVADGHLHTPSLETGILPGITRDIVIKLALESGIPVHEGLYPVERLHQADEVFVCNSIQEITAVNQLYLPDGSGRTWSSDSAPITEYLANAYEKL